MTAPRWFAGLPHVCDPQPKSLEDRIGDLVQQAAGGEVVLREPQNETVARLVGDAAEEYGYRVKRIEEGEGFTEYVMEMDWRNAT